MTTCQVYFVVARKAQMVASTQRNRFHPQRSQYHSGRCTEGMTVTSGASSNRVDSPPSNAQGNDEVFRLLAVGNHYRDHHKAVWYPSLAPSYILC